jgi:hypothetical protein
MSGYPLRWRFGAIVLQIVVAVCYGGALAAVLLATTDFAYISLSLLYPFPYDVLMMILYAGVGLGIVFLLNLVFRMTAFKPDRLFMSVLLSPLLFLATVIVGQTILLFFLRHVSSLFLYSLLAFASLYFALFAIFFFILDILPKWAKQAMVVWYGGSIGAFLGLSIPSVPLFVLFAVLAVIDFITAQAVQPDWRERTNTSDFLGTMVAGAFMGVGDIVCYAAIVAHAMAYFNLLIAILSTALLFCGAGVLVVVFRNRVEKPIPALFVVVFGVLVWLPFLLA